MWAEIVSDPLHADLKTEDVRVAVRVAGGERWAEHPLEICHYDAASEADERVRLDNRQEVPEHFMSLLLAPRGEGTAPVLVFDHMEAGDARPAQRPLPVGLEPNPVLLRGNITGDGEHARVTVGAALVKVGNDHGAWSASWSLDKQG